ncbi:Der GTPase-activating protein YihI [Gallaecimonas mangrovi]|uniref:Der GTPase-activating protein YihI n=1 Tax=Gallaecimonas mangrovi TaxID=2291597 RepID=UPI001868FC53|nr:Der GTPase-activating protein YihI [Gallaecimonas mangrovi]
MKKTRAPGKLGTAKKVDTGNTQLSTSKGKKHKLGNKSGSRHAVATAGNNAKQANAQNKDKRLGSTKPVTLVKPGAKAAPKAKPAPATPKQDMAAKAALLESLENDIRLNDLLDRLDEDQELGAEELAYVEEMTGKIEKLMAELGITDDEDDDYTDDIDWDDEEKPA